jgi:hypothetical protein
MKKNKFFQEARLIICGLMRTRQITIYQATDLFFSLFEKGLIFINTGITENELPKD